jgi:hypothetical protein
MDKLKLTGQNLGRVFNFRSGHLHVATFLLFSVKLPNLQLKTQPKQLLGSLPLVIMLPPLKTHLYKGLAVLLNDAISTEKSHLFKVNPRWQQKVSTVFLAS